MSALGAGDVLQPAGHADGVQCREVRAPGVVHADHQPGDHPLALQRPQRGEVAGVADDGHGLPYREEQPVP
ncbi:hypothetical protein O1L44_01935 [Streptomyces noursei]|nr:hypothetical protein [Streptomyces noursei]